MERFLPIGSSRIVSRGFTIVEIIMIITVSAIIIAIVIDSTVGFQSKARDTERSADAEIITKSIERYYKAQAIVTGATYPPTTIAASGLSTIVSDVDAIAAPNQTGNSMSIAGSASAQTPTVSQYIYQPLNLDDSLCTTIPCVKFKFYYRLEAADTVITVSSLRQQ